MRRTLILIVVLLAGCASADVSPTSAPRASTSAPQASSSATETPRDHKDRDSDKADQSALAFVVVPPGVMSRREAIAHALEEIEVRDQVPAYPKRIVTRFGYYTIPVATLESPLGWESGEARDTGHVAWRIDMFGAFEAYRHNICVDEWRIVFNARTGSVYESGTGGQSMKCPK